ncbi:MAG TPA: saccharopine dehydrogenase NADP-binding domain-containing protein [Candidatus Dormibacteraeota bacterium]|nr:saccharopine dehydrogenase NADP-binding domain-containing protein [Candidatus Dormibacteraeota bacterium]
MVTTKAAAGALSDLAIYGATGFTGKLAAHAGQRLGLPLVLAGRNEDGLRRVSQEFGDEYPVVVARHDDPEALARVAGSGRVLASTAGPFGEIGSLTVAAAVAAGRHYLDSTGEVDFMEQTFRRHHQAAREKELVVMNACAFEYVIGDCLMELALEQHPDAAELRISYWMPDKTATRGTAKSALRILGSDAGKAVRARGMKVAFPAPVGEKWAVTYAGGEMEFLRRRRPGIRVSTLMDMSPAVARGAGVLPAVRPVISFGPVRSLLDRAIQRLPEGPGEEQRAAQQWVILVEVDPGSGRQKGVWGRGVDPYGITGEIIARVASRVLRGQHRATGVVSPAEAFEPEELLASLTDLGVHWDRI